MLNSKKKNLSLSLFPSDFSCNLLSVSLTCKIVDASLVRKSNAAAAAKATCAAHKPPGKRTFKLASFATSPETGLLFGAGLLLALLLEAAL